MARRCPLPFWGDKLVLGQRHRGWQAVSGQAFLQRPLQTEQEATPGEVKRTRWEGLPSRSEVRVQGLRRRTRAGRKGHVVFRAEEAQVGGQAGLTRQNAAGLPGVYGGGFHGLRPTSRSLSSPSPSFWLCHCLLPLCQFPLPAPLPVRPAGQLEGEPEESALPQPLQVQGQAKSRASLREMGGGIFTVLPVLLEESGSWKVKRRKQPFSAEGLFLLPCSLPWQSEGWLLPPAPTPH